MLYYDHIIAKNIINFLTLLSKSYEKTTFYTILKPYKSASNHLETIAGNRIETILTRNSTFDEFVKGASSKSLIKNQGWTILYNLDFTFDEHHLEVICS